MIYVEDQRLDLNEDTIISFNISFMDIRNIGNLSVEGVVSVNLTLPATAHNVKLLGHYSPYIPRKNKIPYEFKPGGTFYHKGVMRMVGRSRDTYNVILTVSNGEWINEIRELQTTDVDLGIRFFDIDEVEATMSDQSEVMYPFFRLFEGMFASGYNVGINDFKPAPNIGNFIRKTFAKLGYFVEFVGKMSIMDRLHAFRGRPTDARIDFENARTLRSTDAGNPAYVNAWGTLGVFTNALLPILASSVVTDEGDNITLENYTHNVGYPGDDDFGSEVGQYPVYTSELGANIRVTIPGFRYRVITGTIPQTPFPIRIQVVKTPFPGDAILVPPAASPTDYDVLAETTIQYTGHIGEFSPILQEIDITLPIFTLQQGEAFMVAMYIELPLGQDGQRKVAVWRADINIEVTPTLVTEGLEYSLNKALPDVDAGAIVKSQVQNLNAIVVTENDTVKFINRNDWYLDEEEDWTDKIDYSFEVLHTPIDDINKQQDYAYKADSDDYLREQYEVTNDIDYGALEFRLSDDLLIGENNATDSVMFASSVETNALPPQIKVLNGWKEGESADAFRNNYAMTDRIFLNNGEQQLPTVIPVTHDEGTLNLETYAQAAFAPLEFENLFPSFFRKTMTLIEEGEFVNAYCRLTRADIQNLDYRKAKRIRLTDGHEVKAWINKIEDLRPGTDTPVKIEFITNKNPG